VLVDTEGGNNMLYLPLDQLGPRRRMALDEPQPLNNVPLSQNVSPRDARERGSR
jgi:hypothetical protein